MTVEKFIRILGYIVYFLLWLPVVVIGIVALPIWYTIVLMRAGIPFKKAIVYSKDAIMRGIQHDAEFIKTGVW